MQKEGGGPRVPPTHPTTFQRSISNLILKIHNPPSPHNQTIPKEESRRKRQEEVRGCKGKYEEVLEEGRCQRIPRSKSSKVQGPKVQRSKDPKVQESQGPQGSKVQGFQGPGVPKSQGPKDQDISNSHLNTSLTLKKVHLVWLIFLKKFSKRCPKSCQKVSM